MITEQLYDLESAIRDELYRAMKKHPSWPTDPVHALNAFRHEVDGLSFIVGQLITQPYPQTVTKDEARRQALQCAAMCLRFLLSLHRYDFTPSAQHRQE